MKVQLIINILNNLKNAIGSDFDIVDIKISANHIKITYIDPLYGSIREIICLQQQEADLKDLKEIKDFNDLF